MTRPVRPRDAAPELRKVSAVAEAARAPEQLTLDELIPGLVHGWQCITPTDYGYVAHCRCGWRAVEVAEKRSAQFMLRRHLARTPQGSVLMRTLRKVGRSANGA